MQTFLPYPSFSESAAVLDRQRLGKQRVENLQITKAITTGEGWVHHPATKMWGPHLLALLDYQRAICYEWTEVRGYKDTCLDKTIALVGDYEGDTELPPWLGNEEFHAAHRSNLLRKDPVWCNRYGWTEPDDLEYIWPV